MRNFIWFELVADIERMRPRPVDRVVVEARNDVPVAMIDRLTGGLAVVDDHIESVGAGGRPDRPGTSRGKSEPTAAARRLGQLAQMGVMALGHEQRVAVIDRIDVEKRDGVGASRATGPTGSGRRTILQKMQCGSCG